jgi:glutamine amidotransferase
MIVIIDYEMGIVLSVKNALDRIGVRNIISRSGEDIKNAAGLILPGVGSARAGMDNMKRFRIDQVIREEVVKGKPILGICLGMQLLMTQSEEGNVSCLNYIAGTVVRFKTKEKVPQIGWNTVFSKSGSILFEGIPQDSYFYFVHSYYSIPTDKNIIYGRTKYGNNFCSVIEKENIFGVQFHPEKSGQIGEKLLKNYITYSYENNTSG